MQSKKKIDENKPLEFLYQVSLREDFQDNLLEFRKKFSIPKNGFKAREEENEWFSKTDIDVKRGVVLAIGELMKKYKIPASIKTLLEEKVLGENRFQIFSERTTSTCDVDYDIDVEEKIMDNACFTEMEWRKSGQPYVKLYVSDQASLEDVQKFVKEKWEHIKQLLNRQRGTKKRRIRITKNKKRDNEIFKLWQKSRKELGLKKGSYKEIEITKILSKKYKSITSDIVKSVANRQRKMRKGDI